MKNQSLRTCWHIGSLTAVVLGVLILMAAGSAHAAVALEAKGAELCYKCHPELKQKFAQAAVHTPVKIGACESCHNNPKALGYGISGGRFLKGYENGFTVDLQTATGEIIPGRTSVQNPAVPKLDHDLSQIVTRDGEELVTIGSHWPLTGPLTQEQREKMERTGLCMGCHQNMTDEALWAKVNSPEFVNNEAHQDVMDQAVHALAEKKSGKKE